MKNISKQVVEFTKKVGVKAINDDCNIFFYNEPISTNLKKYQTKSNKSVK